MGRAKNIAKVGGDMGELGLQAALQAGRWRVVVTW